MKHSRTLVIPLLLLTWACGRNEQAKPAYSLATLSIAGLNELNASRARLTVRPANSEERIIELAGPQFRIAESFTPGAYTFSLELFGDSELGLIASTKVEPCKDVSATLNSGTNVLDIPVLLPSSLEQAGVGPSTKS